MASKVLVIGLDSAPPELVFDRWLGELPTIRSLTERGSFGVLRSCDPPVTVPAWAVAASSRSPGALGLYGFRNRRGHGTYDLSFATSRSVGEPRVWDVLSERAHEVVVLGVPLTYPVTPVRGAMVSCFLAPEPSTHPPALRADLDGYRADVAGYRTVDAERLVAEADDVSEGRFRLACRLAESQPWDLFFLVEMGIDRVQHRLWHSEEVLLGFFRRVDARIARLLAAAGDDAAVLLVSDHGAQRCDGGIRVNEWLRRHGYLTLKDAPREPRDLTPELVEWSRTIAWAEGGHSCRLSLNVAGREPSGIVAPQDFDVVRDELKRGLEALEPGTLAHRPENLYDVRDGVVPDLLAYLGDLRWRCLGDVGPGSVHVVGDDERLDQGNHAAEGLYVLANGRAPSGRGPERDLRDVAPTILALLDEPVPAAMEGRSL